MPFAAVPYYGLASGFLTGKYRGKADLAGKARSAAAEKYLNDDGLGVLATMDQVAEQCQATLAQIALAWLAAQPGVAAPLASATSVRQTEELLGSLSVSLSEDQLAALDKASRKA
ncbi:MAG: aldo/keto reductase [Pirellulales bacterium]|nr:aldo/keto reductase [Pirellulales bacterium]